MLSLLSADFFKNFFQEHYQSVKDKVNKGTMLLLIRLAKELFWQKKTQTVI